MDRRIIITALHYDAGSTSKITNMTHTEAGSATQALSKITAYGGFITPEHNYVVVEEFTDSCTHRYWAAVDRNSGLGPVVNPSIRPSDISPDRVMAPSLMLQSVPGDAHTYVTSLCVGFNPFRVREKKTRASLGTHLAEVRRLYNNEDKFLDIDHDVVVVESPSTGKSSWYRIVSVGGNLTVDEVQRPSSIPETFVAYLTTPKVPAKAEPSKTGVFTITGMFLAFTGSKSPCTTQVRIPQVRRSHTFPFHATSYEDAVAMLNNNTDLLCDYGGFNCMMIAEEKPSSIDATPVNEWWFYAEGGGLSGAPCRVMSMQKPNGLELRRVK